MLFVWLFYGIKLFQLIISSNDLTRSWLIKLQTVNIPCQTNARSIILIIDTRHIW